MMFRKTLAQIGFTSNFVKEICVLIAEGNAGPNQNTLGTAQGNVLLKKLKID